MLRSRPNSKSLGNHVVNPEEEKERLRWEGFAEKRRFPSPTHSFTLGLNPSFSANPPYRSLSFVSFKIHYMDFPDCLLLLLSISVFLLFSFFSVFTLF